MSTPVIGAGAAALGFYVWLRRWQQCGYAGVLDDLPIETHAKTEQPPTSWSETLYLFKEALRYMYQETLGRWHAIDLFFGLAYLSRRAIDEYPAADIAAAGQPLHDQHMQPDAAQELMQQLQEVRRYMLYCQGLKHHKPELQLKHWRITTGLEPHDVLKHSPTAGLLRPAYVVFRDTQSQTIILCVRGTHSRSDMFTSLTGTVKPHHALTPEGVALGYSHLGMLAAARWLLGQTKSCLIQALEEHPGYQLRVVGHSMGGGTAAMLTMMMREKVPQLSGVTAWAIACPACMTLDLAASCAPFVTTVVHGTDIVPTFSSGAIDRLRDEVTQSSWFAEFQGDVQQRLAANFGASVRALRLGPAGEWTQRNIISTAAMSLKSCYSRAPRSCYTRRSRASAMAAAASADHASPPVSPHAAAAPQHRSSWGFHLLSRHARQQQQHADGAGSSSLQAGQQDGAFADQEGASLLGGSSSQPQQQQPLRVLPFGWMRSVGRPGSRPGYAAAASSDGGGRRSSSGGVGSAPNAEVALVESALQACLLAADSGQLGPGAAAAAAAAGGAGGGVMMGHQGAVPPAGAFTASSGTAAGRGAALANNFVKAASKVVLRTKRPAAPGKKDDDETPQPPLQQSRFDQRFDPSRQQQQHPALQPPAASGNPQLPVSTAAHTGSVHGPPGAPAAAAGGPTAMDGVETTGGSSGVSDPAAAASSAGKPLPMSLRSRKGWAWGGVLGAGPGDHGWVESDDSSRRSSLAGGRRVVEYLGHTVGQTGRLMVETTGQLLKSSSNVLFQACTAPMPHPAAAAAAAAAAGLGSSEQQDASASAAAGAGGSSGSGGIGLVAPSSTGGMERGGDADGSFVAALAASLAAEEDEGGSSDSDSDPDLQEGPEGDAGDSAFDLLDQPALRGNISALVAAVSSDAASAGQGLARVQQEEEQAAERLLQDLGPSISEANIQRLAVQSQQQRRAPAAPGSSQQQQQQQQASSVSGRTSPLPDALRRESPMPPVPGADRASTSAAASGRGAGGSQAAQAGGSGDGGGSSSSRDRTAERLARRRMYPAGRVLHLMPRLACPVPPGGASREHAPSTNPDAAAAADGGSCKGDPGQQQRQQGALPRKLPPLTAAQGSVGLGDEYVLLEVPDAGVYGRVKLCPSMVRDHFIPSYLKALDSVLGQLQQVVVAAQQEGRE